MAEKLEIILGLEKKGLLRKPSFILQIPRHPKVVYPSFIKTALFTSNFIAHGAASVHIALIQTEKLKQYFISRNDPNESGEYEMLMNLAGLHNRYVTMLSG